MLFRGGYEHNVDEKGRVIIPLKFRSSLGERFIITKGMGHCLLVLTEEQWRTEFEEKVFAQPLLNPHTTRLQRFFCADAMDSSVDSQGRVAISAPLREHSGIQLNSDAVIIGLGKRLEIWSKERWAKFNEELTEEDIVHSASELGIGATITSTAHA